MHPVAIRSARSRKRTSISDANWNNWRWQLANMLSTQEDFCEFVELTQGEIDGLRDPSGLFRTGATPYYASLMDPRHATCPVRRQAIPNAQELTFSSEELRDPLGEDSHSPAPCVFHKYPDRVLLMVVDRCAIYCRHCNRRRIVGGSQPPKKSELEEGLRYIEATPRIRDVLLSGGDPLLLATPKLSAILGRLRAIPHVEIIRIGTRMPVVCPMRIDDELCSALRLHHPLYINTHFNHPVELTPTAQRACARLVDAGIPVGNQTVLLRGVNSSVRCMRALMRALLRTRVRPYYLFQGDTVLGTDHLRTPVSAAISIMQGMRGWMTGMGIPHLVIDAPGGGGKIPIGPNYIIDRRATEVVLRDYRGRTVSYPEPQQTDCTVPYDKVFFANVPDDDDREGPRT